MKQKLLAARNELVDSLPTGTIKPWDLIVIIEKHLTRLDKLIDDTIDFPEQKSHIIEQCRDELLKQCLPMVHVNRYPSEAVPKGTILSLPALMGIKPSNVELPKFMCDFVEWVIKNHELDYDPEENVLKMINFDHFKDINELYHYYLTHK